MMSYLWKINDDLVLDPTDNDGVLPPKLGYLFNIIEADTKMARINEPPPTGDVNLLSKQLKDVADVEIIAARNIKPGGE